jgi:hypothetical protein
MEMRDPQSPATVLSSVSPFGVVLRGVRRRRLDVVMSEDGEPETIMGNLRYSLGSAVVGDGEPGRLPSARGVERGRLFISMGCV